MQVERKDDKIQITISSNISNDDLERLMDYIKYLEITSKSKATKEDAEELAEEIQEDWWKENKSKYLK